MPASTLEIFANHWEEEIEVFKKIAVTTQKAELYLSYYKNELLIGLEPSSDKKLMFEIQSQATVDWYYKQYPRAREEPKERIPYYLFNTNISETNLYAIVMANNYLDDLLIWKFSSSYLNDNRNET